MREGSAARDLGLRRGARVEVYLLGGVRPLATPHAPATLDDVDMAPPGDNKRKANRLHHELPVAYRTVGSFLSELGLQHQPGRPVHQHPGAAAGRDRREDHHPAPRREFPHHRGRVTRMTEFDNHANMVPGMAIEFTDMDQARRDETEAFVERLRRDLDE